LKPIESVEKKKDLPTCTEVVEELGDGEGAIVYPRPKYEAGWEEERELSRGKMMRCWLFRLRTLTLTGWSAPSVFGMDVLSGTLPIDWRYISEGGATVVFSYNGPHHPILTGKVLRLRKSSSQPSGTQIDANIPEPTVTFQQKIISRLVDPIYLADLQIVPLEAHWVETLSLHHEPSRPLERRNISTIDCSRPTAVLASDLIGGVPCAVEIKVNKHSIS